MARIRSIIIFLKACFLHQRTYHLPKLSWDGSFVPFAFWPSTSFEKLYVLTSTKPSHNLKIPLGLFAAISWLLIRSTESNRYVCIMYFESKFWEQILLSLKCSISLPLYANSIWPDPFNDLGFPARHRLGLGICYQCWASSSSYRWSMSQLLGWWWSEVLVEPKNPSRPEREAISVSQLCLLPLP